MKSTNLKTKALSLISAVALTATVGAVPTFAATGTASQISVTDMFNNTVIGGDFNATTLINASGDVVAVDTATVLDGVYIGGDTAINKINSLTGGTVVSTDTTAIGGSLIGGDLSLFKYNDVLADKVGVGGITAVSGSLVGGNAEFSNIIDTHGVASELAVDAKTITDNVIFAKNFDNLNIIK